MFSRLNFKKGYFVYPFFLLCCLAAPLGARVTVDEILAVLYHPEGNEPVLLSDITTSIDGGERELRDVILERLMVLDARKYKIAVTDEELDRFMGQLIKSNGWSKNDMVLFLDSRGYTLDEGRELLRNKQMMNQVVDYRVRSDKRMFVSREEAQAYYDTHPEGAEATYTLDVAYVPKSQYTKEQVEKLKKKNKIPKSIQFDEPFTLKESELADDRRELIVAEKVGAIVFIEELPEGFELTRLVEKTEREVVPLEQCYAQVVAKIRQERFTEVLKGYQDELLKGASIVYYTPL